ncbi:MAG: DUF4373 domain-containing protein [Muribaculaceae bacterium]|nr:DUF4373 domain-containing protein [Muribaculaceae bacterium]
MARIAKSGLEYFPFDIDFFQDIRIRKLIKRQGGKAITVYALLLCLIYKNGYYMQWDEELPFIGSELSGYDEAYVSEVIKTCLSLGLFDKALFDNEQVLTSKGIQIRYCTIQRLNKRMSRIQEHCLIEQPAQQPKDAPAKKPRKDKKPVTPKAPVSPKPEATAPTAPKPVAPSASSPKDEKKDPLKKQYDEWLKEFFAENHSENLRLLCKNFGLKPTDLPRLRELANMVVGEWVLSRLDKPNYTEWSRHLISAMRQKNNASRPASANNPVNEPQQPAADYSFKGGFGGMDV